MQRSNGKTADRRLVGCRFDSRPADHRRPWEGDRGFNRRLACLPSAALLLDHCLFLRKYSPHCLKPSLLKKKTKLCVSVCLPACPADCLTDCWMTN